MNLRAFLRRPLESYKGHIIGCAPGTHEALVRMILRHVRPAPGVLDIGAHSGALLLRLREAGFDDLTGTDMDPTRFDLPNACFQRLELNQEFSREFDRTFHLITCTDVIEHLDSPRLFLAQARALLQDGGYLALSFPNIAFWEGRCKFLLRGELWGFGRRNYRLQRHISPMTREMFETLAQEVGFRVVEAGTGGSCAVPLRWVLLARAWIPLRAIGGPWTLGESALFLLQKAEPDEELRVPTHYKDRWRGIADRIGLERHSS